jgi:hypothetical protein
MRVLRTLLVGAFLLVVSACVTSRPYTVKSIINEQAGTRIDRVCTHKTAYIPWYAVVVFGIHVHKYGQECKDIVKGIYDPTVEEEAQLAKEEEKVTGEEGI